MMNKLLLAASTFSAFTLAAWPEVSYSWQENEDFPDFGAFFGDEEG